jgi:molybdenum cofactor cytidylyltransferase
LAASGAKPLIVVTGHDGDRVAAALAGLNFSRVQNKDYADGLSTSLRAGIAALPSETEAVVVALGDMPDVKSDIIGRLIEAIDPARGALIVVPTHDGRRGNPVVWSRRFFGELTKVDGDTGARHLIAQNNEAVVEVAVQDEGAFRDIDTPEALIQARAESEEV